MDALTLAHSRRAILRRLGSNVTLVIAQIEGGWRVEKLKGGRILDSGEFRHLPIHIKTAIGG